MTGTKKYYIAYEFCKIRGAMHTIIFDDGALEAKNARESSHRLFLERARSEKRANRTSNRATRASKNNKSSSYESRLGVKKVNVMIKNV